MIGRGIGIASADEVSIAEAELQYELMENKSMFSFHYWRITVAYAA